MKFLIVILSALVALTTARNGTFYTVDEAVEDHYIIVMQPGHENELILNTILQDKSGIFSGSSIKHTYSKAIVGFSAKLTKRAVEKLLAREDVDYITQDGIARISSVGSWGLDRVDQRDLPLDGKADFLGNGNGVNVYVIDTGIYPDSLYFGGRAKVAYDYNPNGDGIDCNGHGTHCAGTVGADMFGVAPGVQLYGVRVLDCKGSGYWSDVIAGCDFVAKSAITPAVASMSLGGGRNGAVDQAVRGMIDRGITTVVAAGNDDTNACYYSPAGVNEAITVGATETNDMNDKRASFSNFGSCVNIFAPGKDITSVWTGRETTHTTSGTSMACPHVTGAVAIQLAANPKLSPADLKKRIIDRATSGRVTNPGANSPNLLLYVP